MIKDMAEKNLTISEVKSIRKLEKKDFNDPEVIEYKKRISKIKDLGKGLEYLDKAYRYCKRTKK